MRGADRTRAGECAGLLVVGIRPASDAATGGRRGGRGWRSARHDPAGDDRRVEQRGEPGTSGAPRPYEVGRVVVRRMYRGEHIIWAQACRVVHDDERGLLLWHPVGAGFALRRNPGGDRSPRDPVTVAAQPLTVETWRDHDVLILVPPDVPWSVWWFFRDGEFVHWYVNLERPSRRWERGPAAGIDSFDHALDVVAERDRSWWWKDADELAERIGLPGYWDAAAAAAIRADGERVVADLEAGQAPFDGRWCDFRPDPAWSLPELPADGWDTPPVWSASWSRRSR